MDRENIARLLPVILQRTRRSDPPVLDALLGVMEDLHTPSERVLAELDLYFDPDRTPDRYVPFLARWTDLDRFLDPDGGFPTGLGRMRDLILAAVSLSQERGTRRGLIRFLEIATGVRGFQIVEDPDRPFHVLVFCPDAALLEDERRSRLVRQIIEAEKPAYVTYVLRPAPVPTDEGA